MIPVRDNDVEAQIAPPSSIQKAKSLAEIIKATREKLGILPSNIVIDQSLSDEDLGKFYDDNDIDFDSVNLEEVPNEDDNDGFTDEF